MSLDYRIFGTMFLPVMSIQAPKVLNSRSVTINPSVIYKDQQPSALVAVREPFQVCLPNPSRVLSKSNTTDPVAKNVLPKIQSLKPLMLTIEMRHWSPS